MWLTIGILGAGALLVASLMEIIKHGVFGDNAKTGVMVALGILLSVILTPVLFYGFDLMGEPLAMIFYAISMYVVQKQVDMKAIRPVIKGFLQKKIDTL